MLTNFPAPYSRRLNHAAVWNIAIQSGLNQPMHSLSPLCAGAVDSEFVAKAPAEMSNGEKLLGAFAF